MPQPSHKSGRGFSIRAEARRAEILLYDVIDPWHGMSAKQFDEQLKALGELDTIDVRINSPGGAITEGMAIHSILKRQKAKVIAHVDGVAASMASIVAMAASEVVMAQGAYMMIHNPMGVVVGEAKEMRDYAELLDKMKSQIVNIYVARSKQSPEAINAMMDDDTWLTADEAVAGGFADRTSADLAMAASLDPNQFNHIPEKLKGEARMSTPTEPTTVTPAVAPQAAITPPALPQAANYDELKAECVGADAPFICGQLEKKATLAQARTAWMTEQQNRLVVANKAAEDAKAAAAAGKMGVEPLGAGSGKTPTRTAGGDPIAQFNELVAAKIATGKPKTKALSDAIAENPELHEEYLAAYNAERKKK